jgi:hypothetical protein
MTKYETQYTPVRDNLEQQLFSFFLLCLSLFFKMTTTFKGEIQRINRRGYYTLTFD